MTDSGKRILMVPDAFWGADSGAVAARLAAEVWRSLGCEVAVYTEPVEASCRSAVGIKIYSASPIRLVHHFGGVRATAQFEKALEDFKPTHVFFLGSAISKPRAFFAAARRRGIARICLWWIQDFFCTRGYGCLAREGPCVRCLGGNGLHAILHRCHYVGPDYRKIVGGVVARLVQRRELQQSDVVMGSTKGQLELYRRFGISADRLVQCPLFFNEERVGGHVSRSGDYFVCYGQAREEKGWHLLGPIMAAAPSVKIVLPFGNEETASSALDKFGLRPFLQSGQLRVISGISWPTGVAQLVAESCGVLIPSIWPTTTEYVLLEALGLGKPVVAFSVGIHAEEIVSGSNGLLAPIGDTAGLGAHLVRLSNDPELQALLSSGAKELFGRLTATERYSAAFAQALRLTENNTRRAEVATR